MNLTEHHRIALQQAMNWVLEVVDPVGVVVSGSIVRGNPDPSSDLDLVVLHNEPWRRRSQRYFNGTPVEVFFNTDAWLRHVIDTEATEGRPVMAHMLATGELLVDTGEHMRRLQDLAATRLKAGPGLSPDALLRDRYAAALQVEDALDLRDRNSADARRVRAAAVDAVLRHEFLRKNLFLPRPKERFKTLSEHAPELEALLRTALSDPNGSVACSALEVAAQLVLGGCGFFEWDSGPDTSVPGSARQG